MISRLLLSFSAVLASVGLLLYGMGDSYSPKWDSLMQWGLIGMIAGVIGMAVGIAMYRASEASLERNAQAMYGKDERL